QTLRVHVIGCGEVEASGAVVCERVPEGGAVSIIASGSSKDELAFRPGVEGWNHSGDNVLPALRAGLSALVQEEAVIRAGADRITLGGQDREVGAVRELDALISVRSDDLDGARLLVWPLPDDGSVHV